MSGAFSAIGAFWTYVSTLLDPFCGPVGLFSLFGNGTLVACGDAGWGDEIAFGVKVTISLALATLPVHPDSLPVNALVPVGGTPLGERVLKEGEIDPIEFVRTVAVARLVCPQSMVRLSAGREGMTPEMQALCFMAGANSIFVGGKLLTTPNPEEDDDAKLFALLDLKPMPLRVEVRA